MERMRFERKVEEFDPEYVEEKMRLIKKGLPISVTESELAELERTLRGARSFYMDMIESLEGRKAAGESVDGQIAEEKANLVAVEFALRDIDDFRESQQGTGEKRAA